MNSISPLAKSTISAKSHKDPLVDSTGSQCDPFRLDGQVAVVTGGGTGLGFAIAQSIVERGGRVVVVGRRAKVLADATEQLGPYASSIVMDVNDAEESQRLYGAVADRVDRPTILVNNAGIHLKRGILETETDDFVKVINTHVTASFALSREFTRQMVEDKSGTILFISSMAAVFGIPHVSAYSAAKTAQIGLVRSLAVELSPHGVRVNAIAPGWIETPMSQKAFCDDPARLERVLQRTPMARLGLPEEVGRVASFLCSPAAGFITGAVLPVDGGASIGF